MCRLTRSIVSGGAGSEEVLRTIMASSRSVFDLVVVGGTPAGIAMAVRASREGLRVLLTNRGPHLGGMLTSGLGVWDTLLEGRRAPVYDEVRRMIQEHYRVTYGEGSPQQAASIPARDGHRNGCFEPSVAEQVLNRLVTAEPGLTVWRDCEPTSVERSGARVAAVHLGRSRRIEARVWGDCTYEGDFATLAGVACRVGRESREEHDEPHAGWVHVRPCQHPPSDSLAALAARRESWPLRRFDAFSEPVVSAASGKADRRIQACNYRTILCRDPGNRVPLEKPSGYSRSRIAGLEYESLVAPLPNGKASWNRPQLLGLQHDYPTGDEATRACIRDAHWNATLELLYFLQNDRLVPTEVRERWREYGLARDEFADNGHRPYEFYLRESRRIVGRATLTQRDLLPRGPDDRSRTWADAIAAADWYVDVHACGPERVGDSFFEGKMMLHVETVPGQVPYGAILPRNLDNLLVPVCLSATHLAHSAVRVEPTWMALGEAAGFAAAQAVQSDQPVAGISVSRLRETLAANGLLLDAFNSLIPGGRTAVAGPCSYGL